MQCIVKSYYFLLPMDNFLCKPNANDGLLECVIGKIKAYSLPISFENHLLNQVLVHEVVRISVSS